MNKQFVYKSNIFSAFSSVMLTIVIFAHQYSRVQLMGHTSVSRGVSARIWSGVSRHWTLFLEPQAGAVPQALTLFGGVRLIAWHLRHPALRECRRGLRYFWKCRARLGHSPVPGPALKRPCAILIR